MSREFLVTKFKCAACGGLLSLSYDVPKTGVDYSEGEPTGAAMVQMFVAVEPCFQCLKPVIEVKKALRALMTHGGAA